MGCPVQNWCVCQWAFASYIHNAGGCDSIQDVVCDAINKNAVEAYQRHAYSSYKYSAALQCLVDKCGINISMANKMRYYFTSSTGIFATLFGVAGMAGLTFLVRKKYFDKTDSHAKETLLNQQIKEPSEKNKYDSIAPKQDQQLC